MKIKLIAFLILLGQFGSAQPAFAHAQVTTRYPAANQTIKVLPKLVWIEFDGDLMLFGDKDPNEIRVLDSSLKRVDNGTSIVGGARISIALRSGIAAGRYQVKYRIVSEDGHPVQGNYFFTYRPR